MGRKSREKRERRIRRDQGLRGALEQALDETWKDYRTERRLAEEEYSAGESLWLDALEVGVVLQPVWYDPDDDYPEHFWYEPKSTDAQGWEWVVWLDDPVSGWYDLDIDHDERPKVPEDLLDFLGEQGIRPVGARGARFGR